LRPTGMINLKIFIDNSFETPWAVTQWQKIIGTWKESSLIVCGSVENADVILVTLTNPKGDYAKIIDFIARSKKYSNLAEKVFVFDSCDTVLGLFPGIYASLKSYLFSQKRHRTGCYIQSFNEFITYKESDCQDSIRYLFSFQGNATAAVRNRLFATDFGREDVLIERAKGCPGQNWNSFSELLDFKKQYAEVISRSKFVLCPRGIGTSSCRLFETMQSGRVPVIISDAWVPCSNIEWSKFSLRVREKDIANLPNICLDASGHWATMALEARKTWEEWFSHKGLARLIETSILDIRRARKYPERLLRSFDWPRRRSLARARHLAVRSYTAAMSAMNHVT